MMIPIELFAGLAVYGILCFIIGGLLVMAGVALGRKKDKNNDKNRS